MSNIVKNIQDIREKYNSSGQTISELESMANSIRDFQKLIDKGWATPRGYTLKTIDEESVTYSFNAV